MIFSPKQKSIIKYVARNDPIQLVLEGAVRSGKTYLDNALWLAHVNKFEGWGVDFLITGHTIGSIGRNILRDLADLSGYDCRLDNKNSFDLFGNRIHCFGGETYADYKSMTGFTSYGWYANEVTLQHMNTIQEAFNRCSGKGARIFWDTNPDYPDHPIKTDYIDRSGEKLSNGHERIKAFHFVLEDNPNLPAEYVENLKATTPPGMWYDRKINGLWVAAEGLVFEGFDYNTHVIDPFKIPGHWRRFRAIDWGFTNPFCTLWGALDEDGRLYIYREYYKAGRLIKDHAAHINQFVEFDEYRKLTYERTVADHEPQENEEIKQYGIYTKNALKDVQLGCQKIAERLVIQRDKQPRLFIFKDCEHTIHEIQRYRWSERKEGKPVKEEPIKINDHTTDCLRYMVMEIDCSHSGRVADISAGSLGL